jgi:enoyl-CoA hydratase/carnithine racemase
MRTDDKLVLETMLLERPSSGVVVLKLNRPDRLNAMTMRMFDELMEVPQVLKLEDDLRVVIITGAGRGFCSGYDLANIDEITRLGIRDFLQFQELAAGGLSTGALEMENRGQALLSRGQDMLEALAAFKEKRPANFKGN